MNIHPPPPINTLATAVDIFWMSRFGRGAYVVGSIFWLFIHHFVQKFILGKLVKKGVLTKRPILGNRYSIWSNILPTLALKKRL